MSEKIKRHVEVVKELSARVEGEIAEAKQRLDAEISARVGEVSWEDRKMACRTIRRLAELLATIAEEGGDAENGLDAERLDKAYLRHWGTMASFVETFDARSWAVSGTSTPLVVTLPPNPIDGESHLIHTRSTPREMSPREVCARCNRRARCFQLDVGKNASEAYAVCAEYPHCPEFRGGAS